MPHSQSPLTMLEHTFSHFQCSATNGEKIDGPLSLETDVEFLSDPDDPLHWLVSLSVVFQASEKENPSSYNGSMSISGKFKIRESFKEEDREALIRVTAASMLYGACREMLANFTARSSNGMLVIPSVSFRKQKKKE